MAYGLQFFIATGELKTVRIHTSSQTTLGVAYKMYPNKMCVFTGMDLHCGSTINWAEEIALAIAIQEGVEAIELRFFDLQTKHSYSRASWDTDFEFEEVVFIRTTERSCGFQADRWMWTKCPKYVMGDFSLFLEDQPTQRVPPYIQEE